MFGVMIALGVVTYTVVFNLNNLTRAVYRQYAAAKKPWIRKMKEDHGRMWNFHAERYTGFKIKRFDSSPSEWLVLWYILVWPVRRFLRSKTAHTAEDRSTPQQSTDGSDKATETDSHSDGGWLRDHPPFPAREDSKWPLNPVALRVRVVT